MKAAIFNGLLGIFLAILSGLQILNLKWEDILLCVLASNLAALIALLGTLQIEKTYWFKKTRIHSAFKAWSVLASLYFSISIGLASPLQTFQNFLVLILPLILSTGFSFILFGPIQDQLVRRQQRKERASARSV
jgi:hypothetical protein